MATTSTKKSTASKKPVSKPTTDVTVEKVIPQEEVVVKSAPKYHVVEELDPHMYVTVRNGFQGLLTYVSPKTGERFEWEEFGAEQDMELQELRTARNAAKGVFASNWFMLDDPAVIDYLNVGQYYKDALTIEEFDEIFSMEPDYVAERIRKLSKGQKTSLAYKARQMIKTGEIDSLKLINVLEAELHIKLIDR